jgi:uncharacterized zinc-type alcohol dehydrogenase-like protein
MEGTHTHAAEAHATPAGFAATGFTTPAGDTAIRAYAATAAGRPLEPYQFVPEPLRAMEVDIAVTHCGMCHTDLHLAQNDFGITPFPLVPGHEAVGTVAQVGSAVTEVRVGQRVGVGWLAGADFTCRQCLVGLDNMCASGQPTCVGHAGGYADRLRADARLAFPIPDGLASEHAAPLLCAGVTVFAPLLRHVRAIDRVGIIGVGGLGHLALQYARAMGCHVTAFSTSPDKEAEARGFGAHDFVAASAAGALAARAATCDFLLYCATADLPWADYLGVLRPDGKLCLVGFPASKAVDVSVIPLIFGQKSVLASGIGSRAEMHAMLEFSALHGVVPQVELYPMREVNAVMDRLARNEVRYRAVLTNA